MNEIKPNNLRPGGRGRPDPAHAAEFVGPAGAPAQSRALVAVSPPARPHVTACPGSLRPSALFLAQLIATALAAPQTRARRRAEPDDAGALYAAAGARRIVVGRTLSRAI